MRRGSWPWNSRTTRQSQNSLRQLGPPFPRRCRWLHRQRGRLLHGWHTFLTRHLRECLLRDSRRLYLGVTHNSIEQVRSLHYPLLGRYGEADLDIPPSEVERLRRFLEAAAATEFQL